MLERVNFYIEDIQYRFLKNLATLTISEHIRKALDDYIQKIQGQGSESLSERSENGS